MDRPLADHIDRHAAERPDAPAFITAAGTMTWDGYRRASDRLAGVLVAAGLAPGERVGVLLPDGATVHAAFVANEKAGLVTVGIGARAGDRELTHLLTKTRAGALVTFAHHRGEDACALFSRVRTPALRHHVVVPELEADPDGPITVDGKPLEPALVDPARRFHPDDFFLVNSTSGTTGLPKCVMHNQSRWWYVHTQAVDVADLSDREVVYGAVPAPFGFGLWTAHFTPTYLGVPTVVAEAFDADRALELIERHRVTMLAAVSTQFVMMLASPRLETADLSSLRVMFTGGEAIPPERARRFEEITRAAVLNFYGANESGVVTGTRLSDPQEKRLTTAGRLLPGTEMRLYDDGRDVTATGEGQPGSRGPAISLGYLDDPAANAELFTPDGFVLHADICRLDAEGYLSVVGRKSDIIIRGGKNISAPYVEGEVGAHPAVAVCAAVPVPDEVFGERVCIVVELRPGQHLTLDDITAFLAERGVSKEYFPERLLVLDALPRSSGGKVAKGQLRETVRNSVHVQSDG